MTLVRMIGSDKPSELLGMVKYWAEDGCRLLFAIREPDGTVVACNGKQIERWTAPVRTLYPQQPAHQSLRKPAGLSPVASPAPNNN